VAVPLPLPDSLRELALAQHGLVTRAQCLEAGLSPGAVTRLGAPHGRGQRVLPGVLALSTGVLVRQQVLVAALLYAGQHAQLAGVTVLQARGLRYLPDDTRVHVLIPGTRAVAPRAFVVVHRSHRLPAPHYVSGLPASPVARAAVDACRHQVEVRDAAALLAEVVQRRLTTVPALRAELDAGPTAGSATVRRAMQQIAGGAASLPEADLLRLVACSLLLPAPAVNESIHLPDGAPVVPDLCWPHARLVVEVDSVEHHGFGPAPEWTSRRRARLVAAGWTVLSVSPARVRDDPRGVLADIEAAYLAGVRPASG
jgi:hypothetical protein